MSLYEIVKSLQNAQGSLAKQAILMQHKEDKLFKEYMRATYDPSINYLQKKIPKYESVKNIGTLDEHLIKWFLDEIAGRKVTGAFAIKCLKETLQNCDTEGQELIKLMIDRSIGASVGDTMVLKTWPDLYFTVPYQRCSLLDAKAKEKFSKIDRFAQ